MAVKSQVRPHPQSLLLSSLKHIILLITHEHTTELTSSQSLQHPPPLQPQITTDHLPPTHRHQPPKQPPHHPLPPHHHSPRKNKLPLEHPRLTTIISLLTILPPLLRHPPIPHPSPRHPTRLHPPHNRLSPLLFRIRIRIHLQKTAPTSPPNIRLIFGRHPRHIPRAHRVFRLQTPSVQDRRSCR